MCSCKKKAAATTPTAPPRSIRAPPQPPIPTQTRTITETVTYQPRGLMMRRKPAVTKTVERTVPVATVDTAIWGPHVWRILHTASFGGSVGGWSGVLKALDGALPCPDCREHYHAWILSQPMALATPTDLACIRECLLALHNQVNGRTEKAAWKEADVIAAWGSVDEAAIAAARDSLTVVGPMLGSVGLAALTRLVESLTVTPVVELLSLTEMLVEETIAPVESVIETIDEPLADGEPLADDEPLAEPITATPEPVVADVDSEIPTLIVTDAAA